MQNFNYLSLKILAAMKKLILSFLLLATMAKASNLNNSGELIYIYATFVVLVLVIVGTDQFLKYIFKKLKERQQNWDDHSAVEHSQE
jgi:hypothetical protein